MRHARRQQQGGGKQCCAENEPLFPHTLYFNK
jgi:hypothetical protein